MEKFSHRLAVPGDMPVLTVLMNAAIAGLLPQFLPPAEVEASFSIMGLDTQLIDDGTYFIVELDGEIAGCGGWSRRATLFGGNHTAGRAARLLDPKTEPARVRAMYTSPAFTPARASGARSLQLCEAAARADAGFTVGRAGLSHHVGGQPLYEVLRLQTHRIDDGADAERD